MPIDFRCPQCEKMLRVPDASAGVKAKCPECGEIVNVPHADSGEQENPFGTPPGQGPNPFSDDAPPPKPPPKPEGADPANPYQSPSAAGFGPAGAGPAVSGEIVATPVEFGEIFAYAWEVWKTNLGILVGVFLTMMVINMGFSIVQGIVQAVFQQQGEEEIAIVVGSLLNFSGTLVQIFLGIGQAQIILKLLRGQPAAFGELFGGGSLYLRVLGASILAGIAMIPALLACVIPGIILALIFWPFYWLIVDGKTKAIESFSVAAAIGKANLATTFVIWLAGIGIVIVGLLAMCVGALFAVPLVSVMWGAGYLMMSGQLNTRSQHLQSI